MPRICMDFHDMFYVLFHVILQYLGIEQQVRCTSRSRSCESRSVTRDPRSSRSRISFPVVVVIVVAIIIAVTIIVTVRVRVKAREIAAVIIIVTIGMVVRLVASRLGILRFHTDEKQPSQRLSLKCALSDCIIHMPRSRSFGFVQPANPSCSLRVTLNPQP